MTHANMMGYSPNSGIARELEAIVLGGRYFALGVCGNRRSTPKPVVQSECESDRAVYCTQYIARSLSARSAVPRSGVSGDAPTYSSRKSWVTHVRGAKW
jgi:hypothetical protein